MDDEEIPGKAEPMNHRQLVLQLVFHLFTTNAVAKRSSSVSVTPQQHRLFVERQGISPAIGKIGETVIEVFQRETNPLRKTARVANRFWQIGEKRGHFRRGFQMPLAIRCEQPPGAVQRHMVAQTSEGIRQPPVAAGGVKRRVAG